MTVAKNLLNLNELLSTIICKMYTNEGDVLRIAELIDGARYLNDFWKKKFEHEAKILKKIAFANNFFLLTDSKF